MKLKTKTMMTKSKIIGLALGGIMLASCQSNSYKVHGTAETLADGEIVYLTTNTTGYVDPPATDSAVVEGGSFTFEGVADSLQAAMIYSKSGKVEDAMLITEPGTIMVVMGANNQPSRVWGTFCNNKWQAFANSTFEIGREIDRIARYVTDSHLTYDEITAKRKEMAGLHNRFMYILKCTREENADNDFGRFMDSYYRDLIESTDSIK